jgi:hypothetical protein
MAIWQTVVGIAVLLGARLALDLGGIGDRFMLFVGEGAGEKLGDNAAGGLPCETETVSSTNQPDCKTALNSKNRRDLRTPGSAIAATICP